METRNLLFNSCRYLTIVEREGLEISQPALDPAKSRIHHQITVRSRKGDVHRCCLVSPVGRTDGPRLLKSCLELCMAYDSSLLKCFSSLCSHAFPNYSSLTGLTHKIVLDRYLLIGLLPTTDMQ
ncbi:hypothetical protein BHM03_00026125 [Ensete ventricosum]|nr:hypothetical protein BHM03_00026125 [Ensete ventricosum]